MCFPLLCFLSSLYLLLVFLIFVLLPRSLLLCPSFFFFLSTFSATLQKIRHRGAFVLIWSLSFLSQCSPRARRSALRKQAKYRFLWMHACLSHVKIYQLFLGFHLHHSEKPVKENHQYQFQLVQHLLPLKAF